MFELKIKASFAAAHRLENYPDRCCRLHGHTWGVEAVVSGSGLNETGMLVDFAQLKSKLKTILEQFDHHLLNDLPPFNSGDPRDNPTAENISRYIYRQLKDSLAEESPDIKLCAVTVWESPEAAATYRED